MAEPLKNLYNKELVRGLAFEIKSLCRGFDFRGFERSVFDENWKQKELKERMATISVNLHKYLRGTYPEVIEILIPVSSRFNGFEYMFFPGYVELYGLDHFEESVRALEHFTCYSSSEFAVRPFIKLYELKMMEKMGAWAGSANHHVRRLATEGCRPRLPWAMALPKFKSDPGPVLKILEKLKSDPSEYVRRSVANNLNDISKDNPSVVVGLSKKWIGKDKNTDRVIKHACRTLLKEGNAVVLELFGFTEPNHISIKGLKITPEIEMGKRLKFSFSINSSNEELGRLRLEYAVDFMKKNGKLSRKIFRISEAVYSKREKIVTKEHSFKTISTRKFYPGIHGLAILINGKELASCTFMLYQRI